MITLKEIKRRFKSQETKDVQWVVNTSILSAGIGLIIVGLVILYSAFI